MKSSSGPKQQIFSHLAEIAAALAHPHRIEILELIAQGERSVEDLAERIGLSLSNTSRHLQVLRRARLAAPRREGKNMFYSLVSETEVVTLLASLGRVGERNIAEIDQVLQSYCKRSAEALVRVRGRQAGCWSAWTQGMRLSMREFCQPLTRRVSVWAR